MKRITKLFSARGATAYKSQLLFMRSNLFACLVVMTPFLASCGGSGESSASLNTGNSALSFNQSSDIQIAETVYFDARTPDGFYQESYSNDNFYVISHIKNTDLLALVDRAGVVSYELSSNNFNEALTWTNTSESYQATNKQLVDNTETSMYYQFTRVDPIAPEIVYYQRVLKSTVLDRNGVDDTYKGVITIPAITAADVKLIVEYLWSFTSNNNYGFAVLDSTVTEGAADFIYRMEQVNLNMSFDESCDSIELYEVTYSVLKATGAITKSAVLQRVILAKRSGDYIEICGT